MCVEGPAPAQPVAHTSSADALSLAVRATFKSNPLEALCQQNVHIHISKVAIDDVSTRGKTVEQR